MNQEKIVSKLNRWGPNQDLLRLLGIRMRHEALATVLQSGRIFSRPNDPVLGFP